MLMLTQQSRISSNLSVVLAPHFCELLPDEKENRIQVVHERTGYMSTSHKKFMLCTARNSSSKQLQLSLWTSDVVISPRFKAKPRQPVDVTPPHHDGVYGRSTTQPNTNYFASDSTDNAAYFNRSRSVQSCPRVR